MNSRPLRVLVTDQAPGVWGAQRYLLRLAPHLRHHGVELTLACPRTLELHGAWRAAGFPAVDLNVPTERGIRSANGFAVTGLAREARRGLSLARTIALATRAGGYDVLWSNAHWTHLEAAVAGRWIRTPVVLHLHEEAVPGLGTWLRAAAVRLATRTVAVSQAVADGVPEAVRKSVSVISNAVDTDELAPVAPARALRVRAEMGFAPDDIVLLAATRIDPAKRIEDLIELAARLNHPRVKLVIAGATSAHPGYERDVRRRAEGLPPGVVTFCGNRADMPALFGASDVVVHTGTVEGMPLTVIEAQSCGKPVIAYDVAGVAEAVVNGTTGSLVAPGDVDGLLLAAKHLVDNPSVRAVMGLAGRYHVLDRHRIEGQAERNAAVLFELSQGSRRRGR